MSERLIPYQPMDLAEPAELVAAIRQRRGGQFINLDRMLLHSTPIAEGWNHFVGEIRNNLSLDPKLRELAMCGVAVLNGAEYEFFIMPLHLSRQGVLKSRSRHYVKLVSLVSQRIYSLQLKMMRQS